jgi:hypothetical protein
MVFGHRSIGRYSSYREPSWVLPLYTTIMLALLACLFVGVPAGILAEHWKWCSAQDAPATCVLRFWQRAL